MQLMATNHLSRDTYTGATTSIEVRFVETLRYGPAYDVLFPAVDSMPE